MKTKYWLLGIGAVVVAGGLWAGRTAWRAHPKLVTLDVREAPLADVLRKVARQTGTKIRAEGALDARITLSVKDQPLAYVLRRLGDQAGGRWSTLYATYGSTRALEQQLKDSLAPRRATLMLYGAFSASALLLALVGIYGVVAYSISLRTQGIGIRMAMGGQRADILRLVLRQGLGMVVGGVVLGLAGALALTRFLASQLFALSPNDPVIHWSWRGRHCWPASGQPCGPHESIP
jgi:hypothetical protein